LIGDRFDLVIFKIPMPSPSNPDFGAFVLGQLTEADVIPSGTLAFLNSHPEPRFEQAVDFMMYLTSLRANETFSRMSGWLPAVIEARAAPVAKPFVPELEGYPRGPLPHFNETELKRVFDTAAYGLYSKSRTIDEYIEEVDQKSREIIPAMLQKNLRISRNNQRQQDTLMAAQLWIGRNLPEKAADAARKFDILVDSSNGNEHMEAFRRMRLKAAGIGGQGEGGD
jgi:raffinose/stachyose/melibiose transport system substrate-binding protein